jgi:protein disulfide-isomerase A1
MAQWRRSAAVVLLAVLYCTVAVSAADFDEKDVVVLGGSNFTDLVNSNKFVLVEFYAPWCGHCQTLAPEYAKAATILKDDGVVLAKVDATEHSDLGQQFQVRGFPTLLWFVNGEHKPYSGGRKAEEIVAWVAKKSGPSVQIVKSVADAEKALEVETPIAVAYVKSLEDKDAKAITAVADKEEGVTFYLTDDKEVAAKFGLGEKTPSLVLLKKQAEKEAPFDEAEFTEEALSGFVLKNKLPLVITFSRETAPSIFESDINKQFLLFAGTDEYEKIRPLYEEAAKSFKGRIIFVLVDLANREVAAPVLEFFSLSGEKTKLMGFVPEESGLKFGYDGDFSVDSLKEFGEKFVSNTLEPFFKSEDIPETNDEPVKVVVGKSFEDIVLDESKDVLLEVYAPWCGHCQQLEPEYNKLAELLKDVKSIVVAKMDGTKNEHGRVKIEGFPTIMFFPAGKKTEEPISAGSYRDAAGLGKFLKENAAIKFEADLPEYVEPAQGEGEPEGEAEGAFNYDEELGHLDQTVDDSETEEKDEL